MSLLLAGLSAAVFGVSDFLGGLTSRRVNSLVVVIWAEVVGLAMALAAGPFLGGSTLTAADVGWSAAAGVAGAFGLVSLYRGLADGRMAVVAPLSAVAGAVVPVTFGLLLGERPPLLAWLGVAAALPAIWLISAPPGDAPPGPSGAVLGMAAGVGFGLFFVFISRTPEAAGIWPLAVARAASLLPLVGAALLGGVALGPPPGTRLPVTAVGVGDMGANILFLLAVRSGFLTLVAVVTSLYPAFTVLLAALVLRERIHRSQGIGLALAGVAVAAIAVA